MTSRKKKELAIVMGVYNGEQWLDESVGSVLGQTFGDFEFLIKEDCSTDGSLEKLKSFKDNRIRLLQPKENVGFSFIKTIEEVDAKYVMWIDQDDRFCRSDAFEHSLKLIKSQNYDFVNFTCETEINENGGRFDRRGTFYGDFSYCGDKLFEKFYPCDNHNIFHSKIFKTELLKKSLPYELYGRKGFTSGDVFCAPMWWFLAKRYLNVATDNPIYEYKNYTGVWGSKRRDVSPQRIGDLCITWYNALVSIYNRMSAMRSLTNDELNNLIVGVNLPLICGMIAGARKSGGDKYADSLINIFHAAFCADGVHLLNGIEQFALPSYVQRLEDMMK